MNCAMFRGRLDQFLEGRIEAPEAAAMADHGRRCSDCRNAQEAKAIRRAIVGRADAEERIAQPLARVIRNARDAA